MLKLKISSLIATVAVSFLSVLSANAQSIPASPNRTCADCGADTANNNGWTSAVLSGSSLVVYGINDIGSQTNNGEKPYYESPPVPSTGETQGYLNMNTYVGNGNDFNWYNSVTGITAGTEYQISILAIGTRVNASQHGSCLTSVRLAVYADSDADGQPDDPTTALESTTAPIVCSSTSPSDWTQVDLTFTATDSQAIVVIGPVGSGPTTISDGTVVFGTNTISSTGGGGGGTGSTTCDLTTDSDCDGILNTAEAAGEANNPCLPDTSAYATVNCVDLSVTKTLVSDSSANCSNGAEWQIQVANANGPADASDVVVTDAISTGTIASMAVTASSTTSASCTVSGTGTSTAICTLNEDVAQGNTVTIRVCS